MEKTVILPIVDNSERRQKLTEHMECTVLALLEQICQGQIPVIRTSSLAELLADTDNEGYDDDDSHLDASTYPVTEDIEAEEINDSAEQASAQESEAIIDFTKPRGRKKMTRIMTVLAQAHQLVLAHKVQTKRSFYYELKGGPAASLFEQQTQLDQNVCQVANLFCCTTWELGKISIKLLITND